MKSIIIQWSSSSGWARQSQGNPIRYYLILGAKKVTSKTSYDGRNGRNISTDLCFCFVLSPTDILEPNCVVLINFMGINNNNFFLMQLNNNSISYSITTIYQLFDKLLPPTIQQIFEIRERFAVLHLIDLKKLFVILYWLVLKKLAVSSEKNCCYSSFCSSEKNLNDWTFQIGWLSVIRSGMMRAVQRY